MACATVFDGCCTKASLARVGFSVVMVRVEEATALWDPSKIAIAWTVDVAALEIAPT